MRMTQRLMLLLTLLSLLAGGAAYAADPGLAQLIEGLQVGGAAQVDAVQLLPRYGVEALPRVLPLLEHGDATVVAAADDVAWAIVNACAAPGHEKDNAVASALLLTELGKGRSDATMRRLFHYLSVSLPEGADLSPITALVADEKWTDRARTALERANTPGSRAALVAALGGASPTLSAALLNSLARVGETECSSDAVTGLLTHADPAVRAAAMRAVARTGDPRFAARGDDAALAATPETRFEAEDALLRYADALALKGGNWDLAMECYGKVLDRAENGVTRAGAMQGLGRYGDETVIPHILKAALARGADDRAAAAMALGEIRGAGADPAIAAAYPTLPADMRPAMVAMMGRRGSPLLVPLIAEAARSDDGFTKRVALGALAKVGAPEAVPVLAEVAAGTDTEASGAATAALWKLADTLRARGLADPAGLAYGHLYGLSTTTEERTQALTGLIACPSAAAFDLLLGAGGGGVNLEELPSAARVAMTASLFRAGRTDEANAALDKLLAQPLVGGDVSSLVAGLGPVANEMQIGRRLGFVRSWKVVGVFPFGGPGSGLDGANVGEPNIDLNAKYTAAAGEVGWVDLSADNPTGTADLMGVFGMPDKVVAYAYAEIESPEERDVVLRMGSDDGIKVWVNGEVVHNHDIDRGTQIDQDAAPAHLVAGRNKVLVLISQGGGGWNFCLRLTTPEGVAIAQ